MVVEEAGAFLDKEGAIGHGAEVSRQGDPVPPLFWLRDPEANTLMVVG